MSKYSLHAKKGICAHCFMYGDVYVVNGHALCHIHQELKQYQAKKKRSPGIKRKPIKKISDKKLAQDIAIKEIMLDLPAICSGCGNKNKEVEPSHLIPRSQNSLLITFPLNIRPHCRECHTLWEHKGPGVENLNDYCDNLDRVKIMDLNFYNRIMNK